MRKTLLLTLFFLPCALALWAQGSVTLTARDKPLSEIISQIEQTTDYVFIFDATVQPLLSRQVSIDGTTRKMGPIYTIIATQNPVEQEGTYKLPEAQLDRFMMKVTIGYPTADEEVDILNRHQRNARLTKLDDIKPIITQDELLKMRATLGAVLVEDSLVRYIVQIVQQTRQSRAVFLGASPRAAVAMLQASKAYALLQGRDFVTPDDIKAVTPSILQHRLLLTAEAEMQGYNALSVTRSLIDKVEVPK